MRLTRGLGIAVLCFSTLAWARVPGTANTASPVISTGDLVTALAAPPVTSQPFSANQLTETVTLLADGTQIHHKARHFVARDAEGRVRVEMPLPHPQDQPKIKFVFVKDPVAHTLTFWIEGVPGKHMATVTKLPDTQRPTVNLGTDCLPCAGRHSLRSPERTTTDLGSQVIDNVPATGKRITTVVPAGRVGNDRPITKVHEIWTSDEMQLVLKQTFESPSGVRTVQLVNFSRTDPSAALFQPPSGYQVQTAAESLKALIDKLQAQEEEQ